jgi:hypothetical protein
MRVKLILILKKDSLRILKILKEEKEKNRKRLAWGSGSH